MPFLRDKFDIIVVVKGVGTPGAILSDDAGGLPDQNGPGTAGHIGDNCNWQQHPSYNGKLAVQSSLAYVYQVTGGAFARKRPPLTADYDVTGTFKVVSLVNRSLTMCGRMDADPEGGGGTGTRTYYGVYYDTSAGQWKLVYMNAGVETVLGTYTQALSVGVSYVVKLKMRTTALTVYIDGTSRITATNASISAAGAVGVVGLDLQTPSTGIQLDAITATNAWEADAIVCDRFDGTAGTLLENHASDSQSGGSGHAWTKNSIYPSGVAKLRNFNNGQSTFIGGNISVETVPAHFVSSGTAAQDMDIDAVFFPISTGRDSLYVTLRSSSSAATFYYIGYNAPSAQWEIGKMVAGIPTVLDFFTQTLEDSTRYLAEITIRNSSPTITLKIDGGYDSRSLTVTDSTAPLTSGSIGIYTADATTATSGMHLEHLYASPPRSAPADTVLWEGGFADGTTSEYSGENLTRDAPYGSRMALAGVGGQYTSYRSSTDTRSGSDFSGEFEVRTGDWSWVRERATVRRSAAPYNGFEEFDIYWGFSMKVPQQIMPTIQPDGPRNELVSVHHDLLSPPVSDPKIELLGMILPPFVTPAFTFHVNGGWTDSIGGEGEFSFQDYRNFGIPDGAPLLEYDTWHDFVFRYLGSSDSGVGRFALWTATEDNAWGDPITYHAQATLNTSRSTYFQIGWYRPRGENVPNYIRFDNVKAGTSFTAVDPKL